MDSYIHSHFGLEEKYMEEYAYPELSRHGKEHEEFLAKMERFKDSYDETKPLLFAMKLCNDLNGWFVNHIKTSDKELGSFLKQKN